MSQSVSAAQTKIPTQATKTTVVASKANPMATASALNKRNFVRLDELTLTVHTDVERLPLCLPI